MHIPKQHGFTLVELVMIIVIIGILAAVAAPRMSLTDSSVHAQAAQIARDIRHVQMLAMARGSSLTPLTFESLGGSYRCTDSTSAIITDPATQQPFTFTLNNGVTLTVANVSFDSLGRPVSGGALRSTAVSFTVSGSAQSAALSVSPVTGFVTVTP